MDAELSSAWHLCKDDDREFCHEDSGDERAGSIDEQLPTYMPLSSIPFDDTETLSITSQTANFGSRPPGYRSASFSSASSSKSDSRARISSLDFDSGRLKSLSRIEFSGQRSRIAATATRSSAMDVISYLRTDDEATEEARKLRSSLLPLKRSATTKVKERSQQSSNNHSVTSPPSREPEE